MGGFKSILGGVPNTRGWITVDIEGFEVMEDGVPLQLRCLPFGNSDWLDPVYDKYRGVPVLTGQKAELDPEDMADFMRFAHQMIMRSVKFIREINEEGKVVWVPCKVTMDDDSLLPTLVDGTIELPLRYIDTKLNIVNIAGAILRDSNEGGRMAELQPAEGFSPEGPDPNGAPRKKNRRNAPRDIGKQARSAG